MFVSNDVSNGDEINGGESSYEDNFVYEEEEYVINEPTITTLSTTKDDKDINSNNSVKEFRETNLISFHQSQQSIP